LTVGVCFGKNMLQVRPDSFLGSAKAVRKIAWRSASRDMICHDRFHLSKLEKRSHGQRSANRKRANARRRAP
jgi:hypothetical protein